jgi:hypothetical protein
MRGNFVSRGRFYGRRNAIRLICMSRFGENCLGSMIFVVIAYVLWMTLFPQDFESVARTIAGPPIVACGN